MIMTNRPTTEPPASCWYFFSALLAPLRFQLVGIWERIIKPQRREQRREEREGVRRDVNERWAGGLSTVLLLLTAFLAFLPAKSSAASKPIMVYYMPWYVAKPHSAEWGWHWTMDHFKPDDVN